MFKQENLKHFLLPGLAMLLAVALAMPAYAQPAPTAWPMLGQNAQRTGESLFDGPLTNDLKWVAGVQAYALVIGQEAIYIRSSGLTAVNFDGSRKWSLIGLGYNTPAVDQNEIVYTADSSGRFVAVNGLTGDILWTYPTAGIQTESVIDSDGSIYVADMGGSLYKLSSTGSLIWRFPLADSAGCAPAIGPDGTVYMGDAKTKILYALTPDGKSKWKANLKGSPYFPAIGDPAAGGDVYVAAEWTLYALNPANGKTRWSRSLKVSNAADLTSRKPVVDNTNQTVYCSGQTGILYAFAFDGTLKWKLPGVGSFHNKPAIGADGVVYVQSATRDTLLAVSPSGNIVWSRYINTPGVLGFEPAIDFDGTLYVGSKDGLYAIQDEATPRPTVFYVYAVPKPVVEGISVNLKAALVTPWDPSVPIDQVDFFLDMDFDGQLTELDEWLGVDDIPPETGSTWALTMPEGFPEGTYTIFAQATDLEGTLSNVVSTQLVVEPAVP